jgi:aerobic-type carbon monoxide dehydrogenase small subunit (CoxS/CutS family)
MKINLTINGKKYSPDVEPRLLLIHYLRDVAGLTHTSVAKHPSAERAPLSSTARL